MHLESSKNISISADNNSSDIARFVNTEVDRLVSKRLLLDGKVAPKIKRKITDTLTNGAQGMFRWVEMSLETLKRIKFLPDFKKALGQLPSELAGLYDIILSQIEQTEPYGQKVAIRTLCWLLCAQRLLSAEELIAAVCRLDDDISSDSDEDAESKPVGSPKDDILRLCRNLIVFDSEQDIFRFAHQSVREYLMKLSRYTIVEQHALATERCLEIYLTKSLQHPITREGKRQNTILKPYAEIYWPVHYKYVESSASVELKNKVLRFTDQIRGTLPPYVEWRSDIVQKYGNDSRWRMNDKLQLDLDDRLGIRIIWAASHPDTLLALASAFGFSSFLDAREPSSTSLNESLEIDYETNTFLSFAAREGHNQVVQLLLDKGADVNTLEGLALGEAALYGQTQILETLLDQGSIDTNDLPRYLMRALPNACSSGNVSTIRLLLERGADVIAPYEDGGNALTTASYHGYVEIVQLLLDLVADVNASVGDYGNALQRACASGHDLIIQLLLDHGADINASEREYGNALQAASMEGLYSIVQLLLDRGADINARSGSYDTALQGASSYGYTHIVQNLLDHGADVNASGGKFGNALLGAISSGSDSIVQILLDYGADVNALGGRKDSPLQLAVKRGKDHIVQMLLEHGADVNAPSGEYGNALHTVLRSGRDHIVQMLLDRGADVASADEDALQVRCIFARISLPSRLKHLDDAFGFFES